MRTSQSPAVWIPLQHTCPPLNRIVAEVVQSVERWLRPRQAGGRRPHAVLPGERGFDRAGGGSPGRVSPSSIWTSSCCCAASGSAWALTPTTARTVPTILTPDLLVRLDDEQTSYLALQPGDFAIFWPGELHRPLCTLTTPGPVKAGRQGSPVAADRRLEWHSGAWRSRVIGPTEARCESLIRRARQTNGLRPTI